MLIPKKYLSILLGTLALSLLANCQVESTEDLELLSPDESLEKQTRDSPPTNRFFNRMDRLFPYFNYIKFPTETCATTLGYGVCLASRDCRINGGTALGTCAQGFGACCSFKRSCETSQGKEVIVRANSTLLVTSEKVPQTPCKFTFPKNKDICQLRLDFEEFETENAKSSGNCVEDSITISGASNLQKPLSLCGNLKDQHVYLSYGNSDVITLESTLTSLTAKYSIRVSQIRCNSAISVPSYCTQYYPGETGEIRSFNFGQQQLNNQEYTVCIKDGQRAQSIQWAACSGGGSFIVSGSPSDPPISNPNACTKDFVQVFGGNRQCGNSFRPIQSSAKPFILQASFDEVEAPEPFNCIPNSVADQTSCDALTSPGVLNCHWDTIPGTCCCTQINPLAPDVGNTGFCLTYAQSP